MTIQLSGSMFDKLARWCIFAIVAVLATRVALAEESSFLSYPGVHVFSADCFGSLTSANGRTTALESGNEGFQEHLISQSFDLVLSTEF